MTGASKAWRLRGKRVTAWRTVFLSTPRPLSCLTGKTDPIFYRADVDFAIRRPLGGWAEDEGRTGESLSVEKGMPCKGLAGCWNCGSCLMGGSTAIAMLLDCPVAEGGFQSLPAAEKPVGAQTMDQHK